MKPLTSNTPNSYDTEMIPAIKPTGFREYDVRWKYPDDINLLGIQALGLGLGTQMYLRGLEPKMAVGHDYRSYSLSIKQALTVGLMSAGIEVHDIGLALSPVAYYSQFALGLPAAAMVTASHNPNGWTGVKIGMDPPLTHGPNEMAELRDIVLGGKGVTRSGGGLVTVNDMRAQYLDDVTKDVKISRPLKVIAACGNGTAGAFAPEALERIGVEVIPLHTELDFNFPHYNPNPEDMKMLHDVADAVKKHGADIGLAFDGDGDRCGVVDNTGDEIFADKMGVILARDLAKTHKGALFVADVKSTGLFGSDPMLKELGARCDYWMTGHSHMKRRVKETGALLGVEKSGHYFFAKPLGHGYDDGIVTAIEFCKLLDRNPDQTIADLKDALPRTWITPTMSPHCPDEEKYDVVKEVVARIEAMAAAGEHLAGQTITDMVTVNGIRTTVEDGTWGLVRASSNTPNLVVVCESPVSEARMREMFESLDNILQTFSNVGEYDQKI